MWVWRTVGSWENRPGSLPCGFSGLCLGVAGDELVVFLVLLLLVGLLCGFVSGGGRCVV